jgi:hypothetical protein
MGFTVFFCLSAGSVNKDKIFWFKLKTEEKGAGAKFIGVSCFSCSDALVFVRVFSLIQLSLTFWVVRKRSRIDF